MSAGGSGRSGLLLPGFELRIADDGELLIRGDTVFGGYYKDPDATAAVLGADGWLRSGDIADIDADGFVKITDRKKDIIVTAGGKNIAPQNIENDLKASKYISQALVVGDRRPYPAALVTLDATRSRSGPRHGGSRARWRPSSTTSVCATSCRRSSTTSTGTVPVRAAQEVRDPSP